MPKRSYKFTKHEESLMQFLWEAGKPLSGNEILAQFTTREWKDGYLGLMLRSLERMGAIECRGMIRFDRHYSRQFAPTLSREEYYLQYAREGGVNANSFAKAAVAAAGKADKDSKEELVRELKQIIRDFEEEEEDAE